MTIERQIQVALFSRVDSAASLVSVPKSYPNISFKRPDGSFLVVRNFPARPMRYLVPSKGSHRYTGFLQISVYTKNGNDVASHDALCELVEALFPTDLKLLTSSGLSIRVTQDVQIGVGYNDGDHYTSPMSIYYELKG